MEENEKNRLKLDNSQYRLRKAIGILGLSLPVLLLYFHGYLLASMSHYYYTRSGVFFIGILVALGLILFAYEGHSKEQEEIISDKAVTTLAAICIFITVLVPTKASGAGGLIFFKNNPHYLFWHNNNVFWVIHLASAGLFLFLLSIMCFFQFTRKKGRSKEENSLYKICGWTIWGSISLIFILWIIDKYLVGGKLKCFFPSYVFWLESIAVWAFSIAWLVKGKFDRDIKKVIPLRNKKT